MCGESRMHGVEWGKRWRFKISERSENILKMYANVVSIGFIDCVHLFQNFTYHYFFTDPTISTLTSGTPNQTVDYYMRHITQYNLLYV